MTNPDIDFSIDPGLAEAAPGPGHRLRQARERRGLDVGEVADRLHLPVKLVKAIESDDYANLPGAVFVQGYLRNYARLVDEPPDDVLKLFSAARPHEEYKPALRQFQLPMKANQVNSSHGLVRTVTWLIVIALAILLIVWWRGYIKLPVPMLGEEVTSGPPEDADAELPLPAASAPAVEPMVLQTPPVRETMPYDAGDDTSGDSASTEGPTVPSGVAVMPEEPAPDAPSVVAATRSAATTETAPESPARVVADGPAGSPADAEVAAPDGVVLEFRAPCWVDIRDASGKKILYGGIDAGQRFNLGGTPPYQVVLGNSGAVDITVGGKAYSTSEHSRGTVARFVLDPARNLAAANGADQ